ncbi:MAG: DUF4129 domain-containing protein [Deltaproteobacteria bacterium]|nr:DUF4129 domain-containing protein [Deltaproteobacteria bacterium]
MTNQKGILFSLIGGGMEMCWLYGWAAFSMTAIMGRPFSSVAAMAAFTLAAIFTHISCGRGWRIIQAGGLQALGLAFASLVTVYTAYYSLSYPFADKEWIFAFFHHQSRTPLEWIFVILLLIWTMFFWWGGWALARRPKAYLTVCARFDMGLAAFFSLFLLKLLILDRGGLKIEDPFSSALIFPFFLLSFSAIGMSKTENKVSKVYLPGYRGMGVLATFMSIVLLTAGILILFFLPFLTAMAGTGYRMLKAGAGFVLPVIVRFLRFIFMVRSVLEDPARDYQKPGGSHPSFAMDGAGMEPVDEMIKWGMNSLTLLVMLAAFGIAMYFLIRWLLSRTERTRGNAAETDDFATWLCRLWTALVSIYRRLLRSIRGYKSAAEFYAVLLGWGQRSGLTCFVHETPFEFGARLNHHFPRLKTEIDMIVGAFNREIYAETPMSDEGTNRARSAWRALRNPRHWPLRIKIRLLGPQAGRKK